MRELTKKENEMVIGSGRCSCFYGENGGEVNIFGIDSESQCKISCRATYPKQFGLEITTCKYRYVYTYILLVGVPENENKIWLDC